MTAVVVAMATVALWPPAADAADPPCGATMDSWLGSRNEAEYTGGDTTIGLEGVSEGAHEGAGWIEVAGERMRVGYRLIEQEHGGEILFLRSASEYHLTSLVQPLCDASGLVTSAEYSSARLFRKSST
ncbi:hypothetical protein [Nocardia sp. NPDC003345]